MKKINFKKEFPELDLIDEENKREEYKQELNEISEAHKLERQRFSYINPTELNGFSQRKMYWQSPIEKVGRILVITAQVFAIILAYFIGDRTIDIMFGEIFATGDGASSTLSVGEIFAKMALMLVTILYSLLFIIPMGITSKAGSVHTWSMAHIGLSIVYFFFSELLCAMLLIMDSLKVEENVGGVVSPELPVFVVLILVVTIISIVGSCLLIVNSDDIKKKISLEV